MPKFAYTSSPRKRWSTTPLPSREVGCQNLDTLPCHKNSVLKFASTCQELVIRNVSLWVNEIVLTEVLAYEASHHFENWFDLWPALEWDIWKYNFAWSAGVQDQRLILLYAELNFTIKAISCSRGSAIWTPQFKRLHFAYFTFYQLSTSIELFGKTSSFTLLFLA